jgi:hypothetical protein
MCAKCALLLQMGVHVEKPVIAEHCFEQVSMGLMSLLRGRSRAWTILRAGDHGCSHAVVASLAGPAEADDVEAAFVDACCRHPASAVANATVHTNHSDLFTGSLVRNDAAPGE